MNLTNKAICLLATALTCASDAVGSAVLDAYEQGLAHQSFSSAEERVEAVYVELLSVYESPPDVASLARYAKLAEYLSKSEVVLDNLLALRVYDAVDSLVMYEAVGLWESGNLLSNSSRHAQLSDILALNAMDEARISRNAYGLDGRLLLLLKRDVSDPTLLLTHNASSEVFEKHVNYFTAFGRLQVVEQVAYADIPDLLLAQNLGQIQRARIARLVFSGLTSGRDIEQDGLVGVEELMENPLLDVTTRYAVMPSHLDSALQRFLREREIFEDPFAVEELELEKDRRAALSAKFLPLLRSEDAVWRPLRTIYKQLAPEARAVLFGGALEASKVRLYHPYDAEVDRVLNLDSEEVGHQAGEVDDKNYQRTKVLFFIGVMTLLVGALVWYRRTKYNM